MLLTAVGEAVVPAAVDFASLISTLATAIPVSAILNVIVLGLGAGSVFFLMWFGARKLIRVITTAISKGKISV